MLTRVVTNAFWATNHSRALEKLQALKAAGLDEINYSTGDETCQIYPITKYHERHQGIVCLRFETGGGDRRPDWEDYYQEEIFKSSRHQQIIGRTSKLYSGGRKPMGCRSIPSYQGSS